MMCGKGNELCEIINSISLFYCKMIVIHVYGLSKYQSDKICPDNLFSTFILYTFALSLAR